MCLLASWEGSLIQTSEAQNAVLLPAGLIFKRLSPPMLNMPMAKLAPCLQLSAALLNLSAASLCAYTALHLLQAMHCGHDLKLPPLAGTLRHIRCWPMRC